MSPEAITPAMRYRMDLKFDRLDSRKSDICFACTDDLRQCIFVSIPVVDKPGDWTRMQVTADKAWQERFGCPLPDDVELSAIETQSASSALWLPETGMRKLSNAEVKVMQEVCDRGNGFTLDMLWLLVEGLGWTLGRPVPQTDPGWLAVWAEEEHCGSYMAVVRHALGMDEPAWDDRGPLVPEVVAKTYAAAGH